MDSLWNGTAFVIVASSSWEGESKYLLYDMWLTYEDVMCNRLSYVRSSTTQSISNQTGKSNASLGNQDESPHPSNLRLGHNSWFHDYLYSAAPCTSEIWYSQNESQRDKATRLRTQKNGRQRRKALNWEIEKTKCAYGQASVTCVFQWAVPCLLPVLNASAATALGNLG